MARKKSKASPAAEEIADAIVPAEKNASSAAEAAADKPKAEKPEQEPPEHSGVLAACLGVMGDLAYIRKANQDKKGVTYTFLAEADIVGKLHPLFVWHGLVIQPIECSFAHNEVYHTANAKPMNLVRVVIKYRIAHAPTGTDLIVCALGESYDSADKATGKAMTSAYKYVLRQSFLIETGDDPDEVPSQGKERDNKASTTQPPAVSLDEQCDRVRQAIAAATDPKRVEFLRNAYKERPFSAEQMTLLDKASESKILDLTTAAAAKERADAAASEAKNVVERDHSDEPQVQF